MIMPVFEFNNIVKDCFDTLVKYGYDGLRDDVLKVAGDPSEYAIYIIDYNQEMNDWLNCILEKESLDDIGIIFSNESKQVQIAWLSYLIRIVMMPLQEIELKKSIDFSTNHVEILKSVLVDFKSVINRTF